VRACVCEHCVKTRACRYIFNPFNDYAIELRLFTNGAHVCALC
jgi:hypothetical protein